MSHFAVLVLIDHIEPLTEQAVRDAVAGALDRYQDDKWDWYQIGGRWTGALDGYDADADASLQVVCDLCGGTGNRAAHRNEPTENQHPTGCNGCLGTGKHQRWPTEWPFRHGDIQSVAQLPDEKLKGYYALVIDGSWHGGEDYEPWRKGAQAKFVRRALPPVKWIRKEHNDKMAVIVDCHN